MMLYTAENQPFKKQTAGGVFIKFLAGGLLLSVLLLSACKSFQSSTPGHGDRKIYVIIDDAGQQHSQDELFFNLSAPLTIAVLPECQNTERVARTVGFHRPKKQLILHQPMEPENPNVDPGPGAIRIDTPAEEVAAILKNNMDQMPAAKGMNNHMGSLVTQDRNLMEATMAFCRENDLFFIDSLTTPDSVAGEVAREYGVPVAQQDVFLDNDHSEAAIHKQFEMGMEIAARQGFVVMIGHAWSPGTATVIRKMYPVARKKGFTFHMISDIFESRAEKSGESKP